MAGSRSGRRPGWAGRLAAGLGALGVLAATVLPAAAADPGANIYVQTNLVSDIPGVARMTDRHLVNPWGMSASPTSPLWVSDADALVTTLYKGGIAGSALAPQGLVVKIPGSPTGQVFNGTTDWMISSGGTSAPAVFMFATESGKIVGWNPSVGGAAPSTVSEVAASRDGASYKGLAISTGTDGNWLYAANFHAGTIDVFDGTFHLLNWPGAFHDASLPKGYSPFNIQNLDGTLYVAYALADKDREDEVKGSGRGFVDAYDVQGKLLKRVAGGYPLNAPWGLALAPANWGRFSGDLLVGNFGNGRISAFDPATGALQGQLRNADGVAITIDGLWALRFGNGTAGSPQTLIFTAGIADEAHGLLGTIEPAP